MGTTENQPPEASGDPIEAGDNIELIANLFSTPEATIAIFATALRRATQNGNGNPIPIKPELCEGALRSYGVDPGDVRSMTEEQYGHFKRFLADAAISRMQGNPILVPNKPPSR